MVSQLCKQSWNYYLASAVGPVNFKTSCSCIVNGLKCTDICRLQDCTNKPEDDNDAVSVDGDHDDAEDSDW